jgi:tRNA-dihydrouridine synthase A
MLTADAVIHGDRDYLLGFDPAEHPVALQLGGHDPDKMSMAAKIGADFGYDEININVGCPSNRVQEGRFGACLMAEPETVAECYATMQAAIDIPVTVKTRIGIDDMDDYDFVHRFTKTLVKAGCKTVIYHARKAWLDGLSPKENRNVPPLLYDRVYRLKGDFPKLIVIINGGIETTNQVDTALTRVDGVMIGRAAYHEPEFLRRLEGAIFGNHATITDDELIEKMAGYIDRYVDNGGKAQNITRHMMGLFKGRPGAKSYRQYLSEHAHLDGMNGKILLKAADKVI